MRETAEGNWRPHRIRNLTDGVAYQLTAAVDQRAKSVPKRLLIEITKTNFCRFQVKKPLFLRI